MDKIEIEKGLEVDKEFCDKLNSLTLAQIFNIISPTKDIKFIPEVGIVSSKFYFENMEKIYKQVNTFIRKE